MQLVLYLRERKVWISMKWKAFGMWFKLSSQCFVLFCFFLLVESEAKQTGQLPLLICRLVDLNSTHCNQGSKVFITVASSPYQFFSLFLLTGCIILKCFVNWIVLEGILLAITPSLEPVFIFSIHFLYCYNPYTVFTWGSQCGTHRSLWHWEENSCPPPRPDLRRRREKITSFPVEESVRRAHS